MKAAIARQLILRPSHQITGVDTPDRERARRAERALQ
jgi:hypothetical protein